VPEDLADIMSIGSDNEDDSADYYHNTTNENENQHLLDTESNRQQNNQGISWYFAVFLIVNAALGAGLLNFGKAFDNAGGILVSSIIHLVNLHRYEINIKKRNQICLFYKIEIRYLC
jgi:hypothetical protein